MAVVSNDSRRPIRNVVRKYDRAAVMVGRLVDWQPGASAIALNLIQAVPRSSARVIRAGETYGFAFELISHRVILGGLGEARFTDDAGRHWQLDEEQHLQALDDRDW
jgi:hypothetical protein